MSQKVPVVMLFCVTCMYWEDVLSGMNISTSNLACFFANVLRYTLATLVTKASSVRVYIYFF